ncbi:lysozyme [Methylobacterium sp. Leaf90]|nr:lysozyme [Methylobacterium sp. Leaf90]
MSRLKKGGAIAALCVALVGGFEGLRLKSYIPIPGDVPTVCYGETRGIRMGMTFTKPQCDAMLLKGLDDFANGVERCAKQPMGDDQYAAHLSLAYNIGLGAYCKSTVVRRWNEGDRRGSCNAFLMWDKAGGRTVAGLVRRRQAERTLCLKGV